MNQRDNVEVYVTSAGMDKGTIELKTPLVGVSGFEVIGIEIPDVVYNLTLSQNFQTSLGNVLFPTGKYTSTTFAAKLQESINSVAATPFTIVYDVLTKKITISNSSLFMIYNPNTWSRNFQALIGFKQGISAVTELGPFTEYTFEFQSNDKLIYDLNFLIKILTSLTPYENKSISATGLGDIYTSKIQLTGENGVYKIRDGIIKFKSKYNVNSLDISLKDGVFDNFITDSPWSATIVFYF